MYVKVRRAVLLGIAGGNLLEGDNLLGGEYERLCMVGFGV